MSTFSDEKTESATSSPLQTIRIELNTLSKQTKQIFRGEPSTRVFHWYYQHFDAVQWRAFDFDTYRDSSSNLGKLDGIGEDVTKNGKQFNWIYIDGHIASNRQWQQFEQDFFGSGREQVLTHGLFEEGKDGGGDAFQCGHASGQLLKL